MKLSSILSILAVALSVPAAFGADGFASVSGIKGQARTGDQSAIVDGQSIGAGTTVETNAGSSLGMTLSNGVKLFLGPGTRMRFRSIAQSDVPGGFSSCEIVLLRGTISGDASHAGTASDVTIRTTAGVANVAGSSFRIGFTPSTMTTGQFNIVVTEGSVSILPTIGTGSLIVPSGSQTTVGQGVASPQVSVASTALLTAIRNGDILTVTATPTGGAAPTGPASGPATPGPSGNPTGLAIQLPNFSVIIPPSTISPNGEGNPI